MDNFSPDGLSFRAKNSRRSLRVAAHEQFRRDEKESPKHYAHRLNEMFGKFALNFNFNMRGDRKLFSLCHYSMLCALRALAMSDVRSRNSLCLMGSSARARRSSKRAWARFGVAFFEPLLVDNRLLLHELDIERAPASKDRRARSSRASTGEWLPRADYRRPWLRLRATSPRSRVERTPKPR